MHANFVLNGKRYECKRQKGDGSGGGVEEWYMIEDRVKSKVESLSRKEFLTRLMLDIENVGATEIFNCVYGIAGIRNLR